MRYFRRFALVIALCCVAQSLCAAERVVRIPHWETSNAAHSVYVVELLRLALTRSAAPGETIRIEPIAHDLTQARLISELQQPGGLIELFWTMTSVEREKAIRPIRIPLYKGLYGHRLLLVREADQARFSTVENIEQLRRLRAGQGSQWPDTEILRHNGLPVTTSVAFENLFPIRLLKNYRLNPNSQSSFKSILGRHDFYSCNAISVTNKFMPITWSLFRQKSYICGSYLPNFRLSTLSALLYCRPLP